MHISIYKTNGVTMIFQVIQKRVYYSHGGRFSVEPTVFRRWHHEDIKYSTRSFHPSKRYDQCYFALNIFVLYFCKLCTPRGRQTAQRRTEVETSARFQKARDTMNAS